MREIFVLVTRLFAFWLNCADIVSKTIQTMSSKTAFGRIECGDVRRKEDWHSTIHTIAEILLLDHEMWQQQCSIFSGRQTYSLF